ncbi:MAG: M15 family metallopeptidase [Lachnospiraceae bacterium]|nr:M15 family metallopeptidase [Lachnospiraceae bacterium]
MGNRKVAAAFLVFVIGITSGLIFNGKTSPAKTVYREGFSYSKITKGIKKRINGISYKKNKYITYDDLRYVRVKYYNYKGKEKEGELIVNKLIARDVAEIFYELYEIKYPIRRIRLVDEYDADDNLSMAADNTSSFNYRIIAGSNNSLSMHALGLALDINPKINPCVGGAHGIVPPNGKAYSQRKVSKCGGKYADNMIHKGDEAYNIFIKHGFSWGGEWDNMKDYQHFYKVTGKYKKMGRFEW